MSALKQAVLLLALCSVAPACLRSRPTPDVWACKTDDDCGAGEICLPDPLGIGASLCHPQGYCEDSIHCPGGQTCVESQCLELECSTPYDEACFPFECDGSFCRDSCTPGVIGCALGHVCRGDNCVRVECTPYDSLPTCGGYGCDAYGQCEDDCLTVPCAGEHICEAGSCNPDLAQACTSDQSCPGSTCCPTGTPEFFTCESSCSYLPEGAACAWDAICSTNNCEAGVCRACASDACMHACGERTCGSLQGFDCGGSCPAKEACEPDGHCAFACDGHECGNFNGAYCGDCDPVEYCSDQGECLPDPCLTRFCGVVEGRDCGLCPGGTVCNGDYQCETPCLGRICGMHLGYECGYCAGDCSTDGQCTLP